VIAVTPSLEVVSANTALVQLLGYENQHELLGRSLEEITHPDDIGVGQDLIHRAFEGLLGRYGLEKRYLRRDGTAVLVRVDVVIEDDPRLGRIAVGTIRPLSEPVGLPADATEAVARHVREEQRILGLLHDAGRAIVEADEVEELLERVLRALCEGTGSDLALAHLLGRDGTPVTRAEVQVGSAPCAAAAERRSFGHRTGVRVRRVQRAHGVVVHGAGGRPVVRADCAPCLRVWIGIPIRSGAEVTGVVELLAATAITVGDDLRAALADTGDHLGRALERLELEGRSERVDGETSAFAATAVHELRSPLAAVGVALSALSRRSDRLGEQNRDALFATADRSMVQLRGIVANLAGLAGVDGAGPQVVLEHLDLAPVVHLAVGNLAIGDRDRPVQVDIPDRLFVRADPVALTEIVDNLVTNAVRHGGPDIVIAARADGHGQVLMEVTDDGDGVPPAIGERAFEPFVRGGSRSGGLGIGLALSRRLAEAMNGTLTYEPVDPHGSAFRLMLPEA